MADNRSRSLCKCRNHTQRLPESLKWALHLNKKNKHNGRRVFTSAGISDIWPNGTFALFFSAVISTQILGDGFGEAGSRGGNWEAHQQEPPCPRLYQTSWQKRLCDSFMCYRWHNSYFFPQPLYMINKTILWKHCDLSSMSLWKGPR